MGVWLSSWEWRFLLCQTLVSTCQRAFNNSLCSLLVWFHTWVCSLCNFYLFYFQEVPEESKVRKTQEDQRYSSRDDKKSKEYYLRIWLN